MTADPLADPRTALARGQWRKALELLDEVELDGPSAASLELRAQAAYGNGDFDAAIQAWEDLHTLLSAAGDDAQAARAAAMIAMYLMMDSGLMAPVRGWLRRADRLLEGHDEAAARALVAMVRTYERFMCGDISVARQQAEQSIELGERLGVPPAVVIGRTALARTEILAGNVAAGLDMLDEIGAMLMSGEVDPLTTGMMYCELICAAQGLGRVDLAREWTELMDRWRPGAAFGGIHGRCRVHRAELLRVSGPCDLAEAEALSACDELRPWMRREFGWPLVELGNIRLRKGDLAGAEEAFVAAHGHAWSPHPGFALLRLAKGDVGGASVLIADAIAHPFDIPSKERPPFGDLRLAPLFDAQAEIAAAAGDADVARSAADALRAIAATYESPALHATASLATARAALAAGELARAIEEAGAALVAWADLGAPFESAIARVVLGDALHQSGKTDRARMEWQAARAALDAYGAAGWLARVHDRLTDAGASAAPATVRAAPPQGTTARFTCDGDTRTVSFGGRTVLVRDLKGLRYLARLLAAPGREVHVLDLVAVEHGSLPPVDAGTAGALGDGGGAGLELLDQQARDAYRRRLAEMDDDIEEATRMNDLGRIALAQRDRDYLIGELTRAVGLGGRQRMVGGTTERARTSVTRSLRYAIGRLAEHHPALAAHLTQAVRTGTYCSYEPDPLAGVVWETSAGG